jgi:hypothetical protein
MEQTILAETTEQPAKRKGRPSRKESAAIHQQIVKATETMPMATHQEIAEAVGVNRSTVGQVLAKYSINKDELEEYKVNQADVMVGLQQRIAKSITEDDIKKANLQSRLTAFGIIFDKYRTHTGQSNTNIASWIAIVKDAQAKIEPVITVDR